MKRILLFSILLLALILAGCADPDSANNKADVREEYGSLDLHDFQGMIRMFVDSPHVQAFSESGLAESEYNVLFASTLEYSSEDADDVVSCIINECTQMEPKKVTEKADLFLLGAAPYQKCVFPRIIFCCQSGYIYYIDFYSPMPKGQGDISYQNEFGNDETIVVFISKLIDPLDDDTYEYATRYGDKVNIWNTGSDASWSVGSPWVSTMKKENFEKILNLIQDIPVYKTVEGQGDWQSLPDFDELY